MSLADGDVAVREETEMTGAQSNRLFPSDIGMVVTDFLSEHFAGIMDYSFTADIEEQFDHIAEGGKEWDDMISDFYTPFSKDVKTHSRRSGPRTRPS